MESEFITALTNAGGAAIVTAVFIWYLRGFNKLMHEERHQTNAILADYLKESTRVKERLSERLQEFSDVAREQKDVIEKLYIELVKRSQHAAALYEEERKAKRARQVSRDAGRKQAGN